MIVVGSLDRADTIPFTVDLVPIPVPVDGVEGDEPVLDCALAPICWKCPIRCMKGLDGGCALLSRGGCDWDRPF